jgi:hypothetical protein
MRTYSTTEVRAVINTAKRIKMADAAGMRYSIRYHQWHISQPSAQISTYNVMKSFTLYMPRSKCFTDTTYTVKIARSALDTSGTSLDTALDSVFARAVCSIIYMISK